MPTQRDNLLDEDEDDLKDDVSGQGADPSQGEGQQDSTEGGESTSQVDPDLDESDEDREAKRARRREERARRKEWEKERRERDRKLLASKDTEINDLRQRLERLETRSNGHDIARVDTAIDEARQALAAINAAKKDAVEKGDGSRVVELDEAAYNARRRIEALSSMRERAARPKKDEPAQLDPRLVTNARAWMGKNTWYDPQGSDEDSLIVLAIDEALTREGYDPTSRDYWNELDRRTRKRIPHRYDSRRRDDVDDEDEDRSANDRRSPVGGSGGRRPAGGDRSSSFKLTPAQVQAMKEAGMWDDVALRNKMIKRYREQSRVNGASR